MKNFALFLLSALLCLALIDALPRPQIRVRRSISRLPRDVKVSDSTNSKRDELFDYLGTELIAIVNHTIEGNKAVFQKVIEAAEAADLNSERIEEFESLISRIEELEKAEFDEEMIEMLNDLFSDSEVLIAKYDEDEVENPTEDEKFIANSLSENGIYDVESHFLMEYYGLRSEYIKHIQDYVDSLTEDERNQDSKFLEWFQQYKDASGLEQYAELTAKVFEFAEEEDYATDSEEDSSDAEEDSTDAEEDVSASNDLTAEISDTVED